MCVFFANFAAKHKNMVRFTEKYYDDAVRFAKYVQATEGGEIEVVREESDGFPMPPKGVTYGKYVDCLKVGKYEIAFFEHRETPDTDRKHRNKTLYRFMIGQQIKEVRELSGMSLIDLSARCGIKPGNLQSIESGRYGADVELLGVILEAMDAHLAVAKK